MKKIVMFTSPACMPCRIVKPTLERLVDERGYVTETVDIFANPGVASDFGVMSTPTFVLMDELGTEMRRAVGAMTRPSLIKFYEGA